MKKTIFSLLYCVNLILASIVSGKPVYTIGAYDEALVQQAKVIKLGPLPASKVPCIIPASFLEQNGSYAGGEAFRTIRQARYMLRKQLALGILPKIGNWHIYLVDADWDRDTYKLGSHDYRLNHSVRVLKLIK